MVFKILHNCWLVKNCFIKKTVKIGIFYPEQAENLSCHRHMNGYQCSITRRTVEIYCAFQVFYSGADIF